MSQPLLRETVDSTEVWTVNRPEARNAIDANVVGAFEAALDAAERDKALRAIVLTGQGELAFISGADLKGLLTMSQDERASVDARMVRVLSRLRELPVPVFAALNGVVMGGGAEVALSCDVRIAEPHTTITFKHAALGVSPGWGGLAELLRVVSRSTAARLLLTALPMEASELLRVGMVDEVCDPQGSRARALALATAVAQVSPRSVAAMKTLLRANHAAGSEVARDAERQTFLQLSTGRDHREALAAYAAKRAPRFDP